MFTIRKLIILVVIALIIDVSASPYSVLATEASNMTYSDGVVTYSGNGFVPNTEYNIRIVNPSPQYLISMINAQSDSNGNIKPVNINVGILRDANYSVFVNDVAEGKTIANDMLTISLDTNSNNNNGNDNDSNDNSNSNNSNNNSENLSNNTNSNNINNNELPNSIGSNREPSGDDGIPNNNDYPQLTDTGFIGDIDIPDEVPPSDDPMQISETNTPIISGEDFGIVPQTSLPNIVVIAIAMCTFFVISVLLWFYIARHKYIWR